MKNDNLRMNFKDYCHICSMNLFIENINYNQYQP